MSLVRLPPPCNYCIQYHFRDLRNIEFSSYGTVHTASLVRNAYSLQNVEKIRKSAFRFPNRYNGKDKSIKVTYSYGDTAP
jgi:hypothetical protein